MKKVLCFVLLMMAAHPAFGASDLVGKYSIRRGVSVNNTEYTGKVIIYNNEQMTDRYAVIWKIPNSDDYKGVGVVDHGKFYVAYSSSASADFGLGIYKIEGGRLTGRWVTPKQDLSYGTEQLQGPAGLNGTYNVSGRSNTSGESYYGTLAIRPSGTVYHLSWDLDGYEYTGVAIKDGDYLIAAWGPDAGVMAYDIKGAELLGRWAAAGANRMGAEDLLRDSPYKSTAVTIPSTITYQELAKHIEAALAQINTMTYDDVLRYRPAGSDQTQNNDIIQSKRWYRKPGLSRSDSVTVYLPSGPDKHVYIGKLEGGKFNNYELLADGSVQKSTFKAEDWEQETPGNFYVDIKDKLKEGMSYSLEFDQGRNVYVLKFNSADQAVFEIAGDSWLPYFSAVYDQKQNSIVEKFRSNIKINPQIPDEIFKLPPNAKVQN